jgi:hypothetical protein
MVYGPDEKVEIDDYQHNPPSPLQNGMSFDSQKEVANGGCH